MPRCQNKLVELMRIQVGDCIPVHPLFPQTALLLSHLLVQSYLGEHHPAFGLSNMKLVGLGIPELVGMTLMQRRWSSYVHSAVDLPQ